MRIWIPTLALCSLWLFSHAAPWIHESAPSPDSLWRVHSANGQLGWAYVELSGPDPEGRYDTSAAEELRAVIAENEHHWWHFTLNSEGASSSPTSGFDQIDRRSAHVRWFLLALLAFLPTLLSLRSARKHGPSK